MKRRNQKSIVQMKDKERKLHVGNLRIRPEILRRELTLGQALVRAAGEKTKTKGKRKQDPLQKPVNPE